MCINPTRRGNLTLLTCASLFTQFRVDNLLGSAVSHEAYDYISDLNGWDMAVGRMAAPHSAKFFIPFPGNTGISEGYKTIDGGMQKVPQTLMKKFLEASSR